MRLRIPSEALKACKMLKAMGHQAYLVGGCIRDTLMGLEPKDWDIATDALPDQTMVMPCTTVPIGIRFGTVTAIVDGMAMEITTFRRDSELSDGRRPDSVVFGCTIEEDLSRRDFTCNAIAYNPFDWTFTDPFRGCKAIAEKQLVAVGDPRQRFAEDALRLMRAVRFSCTKGFVIDSTLGYAMADCAHLVANVSKERIQDELMKILCSDVPDRGINLMASTQLLAYVCPELLRGIGMHQNEFHAYDVWTHVMTCLRECDDPDPVVRLAVLLHDIAKPATHNPHPKRPGQFQFIDHEELGADMAEAWMREMKFSNEEITRVKHLIRHHLVFYESRWNDSQVRRWVARVGKDSVRDILSLARADLKGKGLDVAARLGDMDELERRAATLGPQVVRPGRDLAISGHDVMKLMGTTIGGPKVGECLRSLSDAVLEEPELNNRDALLRLAVAWVSSNVNPCCEVGPSS
jgi:tRNA nucleotidyltransferase (CCA-adding enzyme)